MSEEIKSQQYRLVESVSTAGDIPIELYVNEITGESGFHNKLLSYQKILVSNNQREP